MQFDIKFLVGILFGLILASTAIYGYELYQNLFSSFDILEDHFS